jgi:glucosamine-6-phosphate deaminase
MNHAPTVSVFADKEEACRKLALEVAALIQEINATGRPAVLGLATGSTPIPFYKALIDLHRTGELSFSQVITFNLDEYLGLPRDHAESYWSFMHRQLFDHIDLPSDHIHLPCGIVDDVPAHCRDYEQAIADAGGLDFQLLGIGRTGHIGFNEPGSPRDSRTREIHLDPITRQDAAPAFGGLDHVPTSAITMGCGTILAARRIALLAFGSHKAEIVREAIQGPVTDQVSASFLQDNPNATFYLDQDAAAQL